MLATPPEKFKEHWIPGSLPLAHESEQDVAESIQSHHSTVQKLAQEYSMNKSNPDNQPIFGGTDRDSPLNPHGKKFNARAWATNVSRVARESGQSSRQVGLCFQNLNVFGYGTPADYQKDVANIWLAIPSIIRRFLFSTSGQTQIEILRQFNGIIHPGEMCAVLGPPGSGCSTFLKTISGETNGIYIKDGSYLNYRGLSAKEMHTAHRGDAIYTAETDVHFPVLTVGETLTFASRARCPQQLPQGIPRDEYCEHLRDVVMAMYGISHTVNTKVGDQFIQGVSGGERKRVTIAEATLANAPFQCWDNSTRGLDSANAVEFCKTLRLQSELFGQACAVSMYQAPQSAYDLFDKVLLIYNGHQIYFGPVSKAKQYFTNLGFECPERQTTPDFLTSMTLPTERIVRAGCNPPRTVEEFVKAWLNSTEHFTLQAEIEEYKTQHPIDGPDAEVFRRLKKSQQAHGQRLGSPYILTYTQQVRLCMWRGWARFKADPWPAIWVMVGNMMMALIMSSLFYNLPLNTSSFYGRSVVLFMAILFNSFSSILEVMTLYAQRPIVEKHTRYAFYHPSAESYSSVLVDLPIKITSTISFNLVFYFMTNLHRTVENFFFYLLVVFLIVLGMSGIFRFIGSLSRTEQQAMVPASIMMLALLIFTGFVVPIDYMLPWCRWIHYLNPVAYGYEALMINEFHGRNFPCTSYIPDYTNTSLNNVACNAVGAITGSTYVNGDHYINTAYRYYRSHKWRNVSIILAMAVFNHLIYFITSEYIRAKKSKGEILVFRRGFVPRSSVKGSHDTENSISVPVPVVALLEDHSSEEKNGFQGSTSVFHWSNVCHEIKIKKETRRILDNIDGWVKPGTLTALMGVSGAGKTSLLDCLAERRAGVGAITGEILVNGKMRDSGFQRKTGYAQQQDLHLETSTVREALTFSALLRQPEGTPKAEKLAYVEEVIKMLDMQGYADAVIGVLGEGLNIEQRKRLTIGVELVAKPPLLLFVDEPTSGLDSQTSWAILALLEKLSKAGQSILCTIHQPSAMLFQRFDRLLLLAEGGKQVYFGDIGENSQTLIDYFEGNGAAACPLSANPAEWMLEAIGAAPGSSSDIDWHQTWRSSPEYQAVQEELTRLKVNGLDQPPGDVTGSASHNEFAAPLWQQFLVVTERVFQHTWRSPSYIYSKLLLCITTSLFIGLVFLNAPLTIQGLQNQMFAIFEMMSLVGQLVDQQMPSFVAQRSLYEVRERPAKTYSWVVFMASQIISEIPWNTLASVFMWAFFYFPVGLYKNAAAAGQGNERGWLMWLLFWQFLLWVSTFAHMCISFAGSAEDGGNIANFLFVLVFFFCGVLASPAQMPRFWIFLYRASPLSYWVSSVLSTGLANVEVSCATNEFILINPRDGQSCGEYMADYISRLGGYLLDPDTVDTCQYCKIKDTNIFLEHVSSSYDTRWRNFGIIWVYIVFNIVAAISLYWLARMPKGRKAL
ncbi:ATP-binding cassette transporter [Nannizzia gypsea CBS 118893]|uniref:ATP-binding cassette transporter n=1 Tax=Arthroderma gypseum (strain ATCC MYA-4604 / CBS 118893) TaxID=535722 RepID=E4V4F1_ARTGP|nr:ATP-binding cassette transporter [Nannizzia gypsea CBS 118893]EFR04875.1 ATP-binding cassette transporter [Nannizzia gypsea CBS 118893]